MQRAIYHQAGIPQFQTQASRVLPAHDSGVEDQAINDDNYHDAHSLLRLVFSVLANVVGGALLLAGMLILPQVLAAVLS